MTITHENCRPYDRSIAEAEERAKAAETKRRRAEEADVARASSEQTAQVMAAQEASRAAIAARKKVEAAKEAEIQVAYEMARAAREADAQAARDAARVTKAPALLLPTSDAIYEGARKSLQAEKLKEREAAAAAERDDALPSSTHARNHGIGGAIGLVVWLLILGLAWGFLKSLFQKEKPKVGSEPQNGALPPIESPRNVDREESAQSTQAVADPSQIERDIKRWISRGEPSQPSAPGEVVGAFKEGMNGAKASQVLMKTYSLILDDAGHQRMQGLVSAGYADLYNEHELAVKFLADFTREFIDPDNPRAKPEVTKYIRMAKGAQVRGLIHNSLPISELFDAALDIHGIDHRNIQGA